MTIKLKFGMEKAKQIFGWLGAIILLLIIPVKILRFTQISYTTIIIIGIIPSLLGPAGLFFLILSSSNKWLNRTLLRTTIIVFFTALGLEFMQLLPKPGFMKHLHYTFDWLDVISSLISITIAYVVSKMVIYYFSNDHHT